MLGYMGHFACAKPKKNAHSLAGAAVASVENTEGCGNGFRVFAKIHFRSKPDGILVFVSCGGSVLWKVTSFA